MHCLSMMPKLPIFSPSQAAFITLKSIICTLFVASGPEHLMISHSWKKGYRWNATCYTLVFSTMARTLALSPSTASKLCVRCQRHRAAQAFRWPLILRLDCRYSTCPDQFDLYWDSLSPRFHVRSSSIWWHEAKSIQNSYGTITFRSRRCQQVKDSLVRRTHALLFVPSYCHLQNSTGCFNTPALTVCHTTFMLWMQARWLFSHRLIRSMQERVLLPSSWYRSIISANLTYIHTLEMS